MADPERFTLKGKPITYTGVFVELYKWKNCSQVYEIYRIIELEKMRTWTAKNSQNLGAHRIIEISSVLCSVHLVPKNQDKFVFYVNNYIDWICSTNYMILTRRKKCIRNADAISCKLKSALTRATNNRLEVAREERQKKQEIKEKRKVEVIVAKQCGARGRISSSNKEKDESDTGNDTDLDQAKDKYLLQQ